MVTLTKNKKDHVLSLFYSSMSVFVAFVIGTFLHSFFDGSIVKIDTWMYFYVGIPVFLSVLFLRPVCLFFQKV
ncbi:MAG: hypothetical protein UZ21_OP11001001015 [Microgenomates bacterium OLB22]|nr:MAG: hypothetical protein UZ21_OP11001001015 [Microgenomates bacterium OLB22]